MPYDELSRKILRSAFLQSFAAAEGVFDLGGKVSSGSIRDQVIRAKLFVSQLRENGYFPNSATNADKNCKVCIVGAGPAGLTAAIEMSRYEHLQVWLADRSPMYFHGDTLGRCHPLNRLLILLFHKCIDRSHQWDILSPESEVESVTCLHEDHDHFDKAHVLSLVKREDVRCRMVVPRIGIEEARRPLCHRRLRDLYHPLPYWLSDWAPYQQGC